jgi:hypothetical protein
MQGRSAEAIERANEATVNVAKEMEKILLLWQQRHPEVAQSSAGLAERLRQATRSKRSSGR